MRKLVFVFLNVFLVVLGLQRPQPKCKQPINIYDNLDCNAIWPHGAQYPIHAGQCPACFDCSQINPRVNKCYFKGRYYAIGEQIDDSETLPTCYASCTCTEDLNFVCAVYDCAWMEIPEGCYYIYGLNGCCPTGYKCPTDDSYKCQVDGWIYEESQTFTNPKDQCSTCECVQGVHGYPGDPNCKKNVCDVELSQANLILAYCAAVYFNEGDCCPMEYICPRDDDDFLGECIIDGEDSSDSDSEDPGTEIDECDPGTNCKQCRYGKQLYDIGTKFIRREEVPWSDVDLYYDINCECKIPPYFTCVKDYKARP